MAAAFFVSHTVDFPGEVPYHTAIPRTGDRHQSPRPRKRTEKAQGESSQRPRRLQMGRARDRTRPRDRAGDALRPVSRLALRRPGDDETSCSAIREGRRIIVTYGRLNGALRMVGSILSGTIPAKSDDCPFRTLGIMLDCSRNAVMTVPGLRSYLDRLAILGYDMVMLYTEDTYRLDDAEEPMFGFMRGSYTKEEIRAIDDHAARLGIELVPCIQTLGHLDQIFRWEQYAPIRDCRGILLAEAPRTYELIERMLLFWKDAVRSRRIHLGMDETHGLGTGRYAQLHGRRSPFEIINAHLREVCALCEKHGLEPMIWSDMYFRIGSKRNDYYDLESQPPQDVVDAIPEGLRLVYWDYYHQEKGFYAEMIEKHRAIAGDPVMASGVWTSRKFWYDDAYTRDSVAPCLAACREAGLEEVIFTMWGDNGGYCDFDSAFAGLAYAAEIAFTGEADERVLSKRLSGLFGGAPCRAIRALGKLMPYDISFLLFDNPLMLLFTKGYKNLSVPMKAADGVHDYPPYEGMAARFEEVRALLARTPARGDAGDIRLARALVEAITTKLAWAEAAFAASEMTDMRPAIRAALPLAKAYRKAIKAFYQTFCKKTFCKSWRAHYKPFGLESIQIRLGGQVIRTGELVERLEAFVDGPDGVLPELAELSRVRNALTIDLWGSLTHSRIACSTTIF